MTRLIPFFSLLLLTLIYFYNPSLVLAADIQKATNSGEAKIIFQGKLFCPLKRAVLMPFAGIFTNIMITPGQRVEKGEVVARYNLEEYKAIKLGKEILFPHLDDMKHRLESQKLKIIELERRERELAGLTAEKLSPQYILDTLQVQLKRAQRYQRILEKRLLLSQKFSARALKKTRNLLGNSTLESGQIPEVVQLRAPISGVVLSLHPELGKSSLLSERTAIAQIGKMDTMLIRSLVYEKDATRLKLGDTVDFFPDFSPEKKFSATIRSIDWTPVDLDPNQPSYYRVEMSVNNPDFKLREGFKGRVEYKPLEKKEKILEQTRN